MHSFETYERLIKLSVLIALAVLFIVVALSLLTGCGEEVLEADLLIIDIVDHPDSEYYYHCKVVAREPLPYPVTIRMNTLYKGFGAAPDDLQCCSTFITGDRDYITVAPDTNEYLASFPRCWSAVAPPPATM